MKKALTTYSLLFISLVSRAQVGYDLEIDRTVKDSTLTLDLYIKNTSGQALVLGGSNFLVDLNSSGLNFKNLRFLPGEFDKSSNAAYERMGTGYEDLLVMNVRADLSNTISGKSISSQKSKLGSIEIPITDPCQIANPVWLKDGVIQAYSKSSKATDITSGANYINPLGIELDGGISKTVPQASFAKGVLTSSSKINNQWYLDGIAIPGATNPEFTPLVQGQYAVQVSYPCAKNFSSVVPVFITGLKEFVLSYKFSAAPNPFIGTCQINYSLTGGGNTSLKLYDISGTHILDLESGAKSAGDFEFEFNPSSYRLSAGTYILKLSVNDKVGTIKIVSLK